MTRSLVPHADVVVSTLDARAAAIQRRATPVQVPVGIVEQALANPRAGDRDALYRSLDFALQWVAGLHTALAETYPPGDTRAEEHFGASDEAEDERNYWAVAKHEPAPSNARVEECCGHGRGGAGRCCDRAGEHDGFLSGATIKFTCPTRCSCHD